MVLAPDNIAFNALQPTADTGVLPVPGWRIGQRRHASNNPAKLPIFERVILRKGLSVNGKGPTDRPA